MWQGKQCKYSELARWNHVKLCLKGVAATQLHARILRPVLSNLLIFQNKADIWHSILSFSGFVIVVIVFLKCLLSIKEKIKINRTMCPSKGP